MGATQSHWSKSLTWFMAHTTQIPIEAGVQGERTALQQKAMAGQGLGMECGWTNGPLGWNYINEVKMQGNDATMRKMVKI